MPLSLAEKLNREGITNRAASLIASVAGGGSPASSSEIIVGTDNAKPLAPQQTWAAIAPVVLTPTTGNIRPDLNNGLQFKLALTGNGTLLVPNNFKVGQTFTIFVTRAAAQTLSFDASYKGHGSVALPSASGSSFIVTATVLASNNVPFSVAGLVA